MENKAKSTDNKPRMRLVKIRLAILNALRRFPMTPYEIHVYKKIDLRAVQRQLHYLNELDKVEKYYIPTLDKELWRLKRKKKK